MKNENTTWIDLTMLVNWQGQLTGIQRVEYNLARRFAKQKNVKFCVFDKPSRKLYEYDFAIVQAKIESLNAAGSPEISSIQSPNSYLISLRKTIGPMLPPLAKKKLKTIYRKTKQRSANSSARIPVKLADEDELIILSGDWSDEIFYTMLNDYKSEINFKITQIVYDLLPAVQPAFFVPGMPEQVSNYMSAVFAISELILAISEATKRDIQQFQKKYNLPPVPVKVFRLGEDFADRKPVKPKLPIKENNFLLCIGTIEARKNHMALYYMVREAQRRGIEIPPVVIAGKIGWLVNDFVYLVQNDPVISQKILLLNSATDSEITWLFENCLFSLYPSFYEGWGLPISESLYYGKLCLASGVSSMPEIAGELIDYFSPNDPAEILDCALKYISNPTLLSKKEAEIKALYKSNTWDKTFDEVKGYLSDLD